MRALRDFNYYQNLKGKDFREIMIPPSNTYYLQAITKYNSYYE